MEQENNSILNLFGSLGKILSNKSTSTPNSSPNSTPQTDCKTCQKNASGKATIDFLLAHEKRKNSILDKNNPNK